ncbi:rRNA maturation RNase YbeY [Candidatus Parcubacteria bacterium]|nr:rRNA maturation RNase YbeY [Patescibacteria group bacterium]MCG2697916.1 rRNA maturation RNase YbeY [Candidatus Parcubacteria bacterium]
MIEINNKTRSKIDARLVKGVAQKFLTYYNKESRLAAANGDHANVDRVELSIAFVGDKTIRGLNKAYRGVEKTTDVLTFSGEDEFLGEIIVNYRQVKKQAKKFNNSVRQELIFILVHGLLHLLGYDDQTEKGRMEMERMGEEFINKIV